MYISEQVLLHIVCTSIYVRGSLLYGTYTHKKKTITHPHIILERFFTFTSLDMLSQKRI